MSPCRHERAFRPPVDDPRSVALPRGRAEPGSDRRADGPDAGAGEPAPAGRARDGARLRHDQRPGRGAAARGGGAPARLRARLLPRDACAGAHRRERNARRHRAPRRRHGGGAISAGATRGNVRRDRRHGLGPDARASGAADVGREHTPGALHQPHGIAHRELRLQPVRGRAGARATSSPSPSSRIRPRTAPSSSPSASSRARSTLRVARTSPS